MGSRGIVATTGGAVSGLERTGGKGRTDCAGRLTGGAGRTGSIELTGGAGRRTGSIELTEGAGRTGGTGRLGSDGSKGGRTKGETLCSPRVDPCGITD